VRTSKIFVLLITVVLPGVTQTGVSQTRRATVSRRQMDARAEALPDGVSAKEIKFYSEGVACYGKLFLPNGTDAQSKFPAVVLAPAWGETCSSIEKYAAQFANSGLVALAIDYRGWGRSGGFVQTAGPVKTDDRLRFSQMTTIVRIKRKVLDPQKQILDIRNALYYLQGEPGVDRSRIGVWGAGQAGGHVIVVAANDSRIKAAVAQRPIIEGKDTPKKASVPSSALLRAAQRQARSGDATVAGAAAGTQDFETTLALSEYHPFWDLELIPKTTALLFVIVDRDARVKNETNAIAASKLVKGPTDVVSISGTQISSGVTFDNACKAAADWFLKHL